MISLSLQELATATGGRLLGENIQIDAVGSDSRAMKPGSLFVALVGERFDGHDFAANAVTAGASALLVERELPLAVPQLLVESGLKALGQIGALVRDKVNPECVALTGSNGKTTVKEMIATVLSQRHRVLFTAGNFNNDIGVPLTLLRLSAGDEYGVFELGANHKGEIDYTSALVRPRVALVNNVGSAHLEGFGSIEGVAAAKSEIYGHLPDDGVAVINADDAFADFMAQAAAGHKMIRFGIHNQADVTATGLEADAFGCYGFQLHWQKQTIAIKLPLAGAHQVNNALACTSVCLALGLSLAEIASGLAALKPVKGRMLPHRLGRLTLVDDSYNANPSSVKAAIDWLREINGNRCLVLGDLGELGDNAALLHAEVGDLARDSGIEALFCLGRLSEHCSRAFGSEHFVDLDVLVNKLIKHINQLHGNVTVLVKGSRSAAMERVVEALIAAHGRGELK
ncbi:UDP-N-acetylmuramoyl-tripeptide--D-alanyl-D-alanine ligase [Shewanella cyperi]|uniref:UDP-N-acetylmuramoyl-tripeptide--D-alanyl-D-alanine ligase n=1 Tax=Shewanella cyperi TaxID=2814292 RepID=A0A975ALG8_9GAMM|nr:UDP-N-acetylmuramoyl-tripeptide--D-alanyl-D-alanine ligase [Shewanella cyperi]QSX30392.1 UDP-N-acetylmuramoyl-tripeptide--D-alanyl-D-alanine ligase [Shewanella cyperi]